MSARRRYTDSVTNTHSPFSGRYDEKTQAALLRLNQLSLSKLTLYNEILNRDDYQQLFSGAICLMVYSPTDYRDKFSGVVLDALYAGCPIIGVADAWMGETVEAVSGWYGID